MRNLIFCLFVISSSVYANKVQKFKEQVKAMSDDEIWEQLQIRNMGSGQWSAPGGSKGWWSNMTMDRKWSGVGACFASYTSPKKHACNSYFKAYHPNNIVSGGYVGYPKGDGSANRPVTGRGTGCLDGCYYDDSNYNNKNLDGSNLAFICSGNANYKTKAARIVRMAMDDPDDPCGIQEFSTTPFFPMEDLKVTKILTVESAKSLVYAKGSNGKILPNKCAQEIEIEYPEITKKEKTIKIGIFNIPMPSITIKKVKASGLYPKRESFCVQGAAYIRLVAGVTNETGTVVKNNGFGKIVTIAEFNKGVTDGKGLRRKIKIGKASMIDNSNEVEDIGFGIADNKNSVDSLISSMKKLSEHESLTDDVKTTLITSNLQKLKDGVTWLGAENFPDASKIPGFDEAQTSKEPNLNRNDLETVNDSVNRQIASYNE